MANGQGGQGGSPFGQMLQNFMMLSQVKHQQEQMEMQRRQNMIQGLGQFIDVARSSPTPESLENAKSFFSQTLGIDPNTLNEVAASILPSLTTQTEAAVHRGRGAMGAAESGAVDRATTFRVLTGQSPFEAASGQFLEQTLGSEGPISDALRSRLAAGMSPGQLRMDTTLTNMPEDYFSRRHMIEGGQELSAVQAETRDLQWADYRQRERFHKAEMALREKGLELDMRNLEAKLQAGQDENILKEIEEYAKSVRSLTETRASRSAQEIQAAEGLVNLQAQRLVDLGVLQPEWWVTQDGRYLSSRHYDPEYARSQGWRPIAPNINETARKNFFERKYR